MVAVVTDGHKYLTSASVPRGTAKETEELAIALALTQAKTSTIITDSQEACRSFQSGWVAPVTLRILENKAPDRQVDIVWTPAHSSMRGNEHAHLTARDLAHQATEETLEPTPLTTYQEITQHYRLNRRTLPTPHPSLTRSTTPRGGRTPGSLPGSTPLSSATPLRDKLNINPEDHLDFDTNQSAKQFQKQTKQHLLKALSSLPAPKNDYEIVVPEDDPSLLESASQEHVVEDQADMDSAKEHERLEKLEAERKLQSQAVQRDLPRPLDVNASVLRPAHTEPPLTDLQRAEELIKQEMLVMQHYDALHHPTAHQRPGGGPRKGAPMDEAQHLAYLDRHPYRKYSQEDLEAAEEVLKAEMEVVRRGMGHGDLSLEAYSQVWDECLAQVLFLPAQNRYTRANLASKKDRIESLDKRLEQNRGHMTREAKKAAKVEKKLRVLLGGYQSRGQALIKQIQELAEQIEQTHLELKTFQALQEHESLAIPKRVEALTEDVNRQVEREKALQKRYNDLLQQKELVEEALVDVQS
ncbi:hypothetical protein HPB47_010910 [Ixodes persulcatus]|uniref:Uncharacterized protein n=1 Tax=Ixodes persulcatus TaxID=34615 RepID=A0AC60NYK5_IXOPE|nr:hypothetical protein HPB47_010910 [Ixodes persulcatus]